MKYSFILLFALALVVTITADAQTKKKAKDERHTKVTLGQVNHDAMIYDLASLGADAYFYKIRPTAKGGGNGAFVGYTISPNSYWGNNNPNATYTVSTPPDSQIVLTGVSKKFEGATITITYDGDGRVTSGPTASGF